MIADVDPFTVVDLYEIYQALQWRNHVLHLDSSTLTVRVKYKIDMILESEISA